MDLPSPRRPGLRAPRLGSPRGLAWGLVAAGAALGLAALASGAPREGGALLLFMAAGAGLLCWARLPEPTLLLAAAALLASSLASAFHLYVEAWWVDDLVHALNVGAMVAASLHWLWRARIVWARPLGASFVALGVALGLLAGLAWEVAELGFLTLTPGDTLRDVLWDALGAALGARLAGRLIARHDVTPAR